ncbi:MAG: AAA family ATPase [Clostridiales bacterium]|nr:AAA family ATPase [Clostridiales bacterium]
MKKLNLLKPNLRTGYLNNGRGEEVSYLQLMPEMGIKALEQDVENGAEQYRELLEFSKKRLSQFVLIRSANQEEGLMAVTYLASIYNERERKQNYSEYSCLYEEDMEYEEFSVDEYDAYEEESWEEQPTWEEDPGRIPVVTFTQLCGFDEGIFASFHGTMGFSSARDKRGKPPYWKNARKEAICFIGTNEFCEMGQSIIRELKRYSDNRHVYMIIHQKGEDTGHNEMNQIWNEPCLCDLVLEYTVEVIDVSTDKKHRKKYYEELFHNWIKEKSCTLAQDFPKEKIIQKILSFHNPCKSEMMEKVIHYITKDVEKQHVISEEDFQILNKFQSLGFLKGKDGYQSAKQRLNSLVGMDSVKEQICGIVATMQFNQARKEYGLGNTQYHNVHMMLGAPGTAKTTVAQLLGAMMAEQKLIATNRFISVNGAELKGMYVGHSAPKVKALFDHYDIILIDEAYAIAAGNEGDADSFSQEAISQLLIELEKHGADKLVIFAGYGGRNIDEKDNKMKQFLETNPGIRSRVNSTIYFDSYTPEQMADIFVHHAQSEQFTLEKGAGNIVREYFCGRVAESDFGNGREARSLLENSIKEAAKRIAQIPKNKQTKKHYQLLCNQDIVKAIEGQKEGFLMQKGKTKSRCGFAT